MEVFECAVCDRPIQRGEGRGYVMIYRTDDPRRRSVWGPRVVLTT